VPGSEGPRDWDARLRAAGLRSTVQRRAVLEALGRLSHATVDELAAEVQRSMPDVSLSTVYRTLEALDEVGLVTHAHLTHGAPTYHSVDEEPHIHLVCSTCGGVQQESVDVALSLAEAVHRAGGFRVDLTHLALHGRCAACSRRVAEHGDGTDATDPDDRGSAGADPVLPPS
jgi:Fur family ferric uptake transcriptional regulator